LQIKHVILKAQLSLAYSRQTVYYAIPSTIIVNGSAVLFNEET